MKILALHPQDDAAQQAIQALKASGHGVLFSESSEDVWQTLQMHSGSIDLVWLHREAVPGVVECLAKIRGDATHSETAVLFSSSEWSDGQFAEHQATPAGANAYLRWPSSPNAVRELISEIFGEEEAPAAAPVPVTPTAPPSGGFTNPSLDLSLAAPVLEIPTALGLKPPTQSLDLPLEMPSLEASVSIAPVEDIAPAEIPVLAEAHFEPPPQPVEPEAAVAEVPESELAQAMPYIFGGQASRGSPGEAALSGWSVPMGDAVVPGGAAQSPDIDTLKKYLLLREQDVIALSAQLKTARDQIKSLEDTLNTERARSAELAHIDQQNQRRINDFEKEKAQALSVQQTQIHELEFQLKARGDKLQSLEAQVRESTSEVEQIKERVRQDIRKIRIREKELENRLEIVRRDSDALLSARETKIIELKRRLDLLEFNMDLLQDQCNKQRELNQKLEDKLARAAQVVRVAGGLLVEEKTKQAS